MIWKKFNRPVSRLVISIALIGVVVGSAFAAASPAQAHCDSAKGPVATSAHQALTSGDIKLILPYVQPESEAELTAAFKEARKVRKSGGAAEELADRYFIETAVRLHREGEGAAYTGVTDEETPAAILAADHAMASGSTDEVIEMLDHAMREGLEKKYQAVIDARKEAKHLNTVEAHRERVEAELMFEKYVFEMYTNLSSAEELKEGHNH